ncbi:alpha/beta fold hydrolase [Pedobacter yulinensis]|nr:alpha/beta fold hydrolase [Pedobacter yulinensis]
MIHTWLDKHEYPFTSRYFAQGAFRQHYIDEGAGQILLFVHGTPSWSFEFRNLISALHSNYRCVAPDHLGFGLSDKPGSFPYSTPRHSELLETFVSGLGLKNITLVVHDFGGPIGLSFAMRRPDLVQRIVVLNSWLWSSADEPGFKKLKKALSGPWVPFLYKYLNFPLRVLLPASFGRRKLPHKIRRQYRKPYASVRDRVALLACARALLRDQDWFESLWQKRGVLAAKPVLILWGTRDPMIAPAYAERFSGGFPLAQLYYIENAGHFPHEEEPDCIVSLIRAFIE